MVSVLCNWGLGLWVVVPYWLPLYYYFVVQGHRFAPGMINTRWDYYMSSEAIWSIQSVIIDCDGRVKRSTFSRWRRPGWIVFCLSIENVPSNSLSRISVFSASLFNKWVVPFLALTDYDRYISWRSGQICRKRVCIRISCTVVHSVLVIVVLWVVCSKSSSTVDLAVSKSKFFFSFSVFFLGQMQDAGHTDQTETSEWSRRVSSGDMTGLFCPRLCVIDRDGLG